MEELGTSNHETLGRYFLDALKLPGKTCLLVDYHVKAKRYLCWKNPSYYKKLSDASKGTLRMQGGPMEEDEARKFEADPLFESSIKMRTWDEKAKIVKPDFKVPELETYTDMIVRAVRRRCARDSYANDGFILLKNALTAEQKKNLISWIDDIQNWPATAGKWMLYFETINGKEALCRTENFLPYHDGVRNLLTEGELQRIISELLGCESCVFKEKINYKLSGGGGFPAHQDAPAFVHFGQKHHLTLNIAIDPATPENGCLEVSPGNRSDLLPQNVNGGISEDCEKSLSWVPVPLEPGDVLLFSSWLPHRSGKNNTQNSRRALYVTYNAKFDGDFRERYYKDKREKFPQKIERVPGKDYSDGAKTYNLATPIDN